MALYACRVLVTLKFPVTVLTVDTVGRAVQYPNDCTVLVAVEALARFKGSLNDLIQAVPGAITDDTIYSNPGVIVPPSIDDTNREKVDVFSPSVLTCNCVCAFMV